ncbi:TPA: cysteine synthase A [Candidatus Galligastranaerophilus faecipullorum]|nr:cysteine synthase A [Candidatus Galligastranaerophilus faecipullorum]
MPKLYSNILDLIGNTPIVRVNGTYNGYKPKNLYAKLEYFNPGGSIKDRVACNMIKSALDDLEIGSDTVIVEPTSGNTGVGIALCASVLGLEFIAVMPENMSDERKKLIAAYGAKIVLTPKNLGMQGAVDKAAQIAQKLRTEGKNIFETKQFENPDNPLTHIKTADEIWEATEGRVDAIIAGIGTGGTISGCAKRLKELNPKIKAYGVEAAESPLLTKGVAAAHAIQGISSNFVPKTLDMSVIDKVIDIKGDEAIEITREAAKKEGLLVGISSGAVLKAGIELDKKYSFEGKEKIIVCILADNGERYLSGGVF